jgi:hypothetical protein
MSLAHAAVLEETVVTVETEAKAETKPVKKRFITFTGDGYLEPTLNNYVATFVAAIVTFSIPTVYFLFQADAIKAAAPTFLP